MKQQASRLVWFVFSTVLLCALLGGLYGRQVEATTNGDDSDVKNSLTEFTRVYDVVEQNYADAVDPGHGHLRPHRNECGSHPGRPASSGSSL